MTVKAILRSKVLADGTSPISIYVYQDGKKRYFSTGFRIDPRDWDKNREAVRRTNPLAATYNRQIQKKIMEIKEKLITGHNVRDIGKKKNSGSLIAFAEKYIGEVKAGIHDIKMSTCKNYEYCLKKLKLYMEYRKLNDLTFEDIDLDFYYDFSQFLREHHNCRLPGISKHIKNLKKFMNEALARGIHENKKHKDPAFKIHKKSISNKIWLTEEDIEKLEALDLSTQPALERERDRWLVSYYFLMRYSDSIRIRKEWVFEKTGKQFLRYESKKTNIEVILPIKPKAWKLLKKYNFKFMGDTNQVANRKLKIIGAMAGIVDVVSEGKKKGPKCSFLATHTARRSAATQMYLQGVSLKVIAALGGWKRMETLKLYLRASGLDTAVMAGDLEFFK